MTARAKSVSKYYNDAKECRIVVVHISTSIKRPLATAASVVVAGAHSRVVRAARVTRRTRCCVSK
jgi:hypothetical protein